MQYAKKVIHNVIKPTRQILSANRVHLAGARLQSNLKILQDVQQHVLVPAIEDDVPDVVSMIIGLNDCIVATILWFNALVGKAGHAPTPDWPPLPSDRIKQNVDLDDWFSGTLK